MDLRIHIFNDTGEKFIPRKKISETVERVLRGEKITEAGINVVLVSDEKLHSMNREFLKHDYPTDVITFPLADSPLEGEIYISLDMARTQAREYGVSLTNELMRLAAHGALHLAGYDDATTEDREHMSRLETRYISA